MKRDLTYALDECLTLLREGRATLEECLARYPEHASDLRPLLQVALTVSRVPPPVPSPASFTAGKQRMLAALAEKKRRQTAPFIPLLRLMPAFQLALAAILVLVLFAIGRLVHLPEPGVTSAQMARLDQVSGTVECRPAGSATWHLASAGEQVQTGERVRTGPLSAATLVFFDGSTTRLQAETEVAVVQASSRPGGGRTIILRQTVGQTCSRVQRLPDPASRFEIETPTAVTSVRGTEFTVAVEAGGATHVAVAAGVVEVTAQGTTVAVQAGQETAVQPEHPPSSPIPRPQATPTPTPTLAIPATDTAPAAPAPTAAPMPTHTPPSRDQIETPPPPGQTKTPQPPGQTKTPQPPGRTKTPQPPGQTKTPQPPGHTKTPQPPGQNEPPQPPGQNKPKPPKKP